MVQRCCTTLQRPVKRRRVVTDVVLVNMPFGTLNAPSIGMSLVAAALRQRSFTVSERYFTITYGERIGATLYDAIALSRPELLIGEWVFARCAFGERPATTYYRDVLDGGGPQSGHAPAFGRDLLMELQEDAAAFVDACAERVLAEDPRIVGFTSVFQQNVAALALASRLKARNPKLLTMFGGANCEGPMGAALQRSFSWLDCVVSGEADAIVGDLVGEALACGRFTSRPGVYAAASCATEGASTTPRVKDLDALPALDYGTFIHEYAALTDPAKKPPRVLFETSRGCWWGEKNHCTFCGLNGSSLAFRSKSPARALSELRELTTRYPGVDVGVVDNILNMKYFKDVLPVLATWEEKPNLFYEVKANLKKEQIALLARAGISAIQPGIESLGSATLKLMRKGVSPLQNIQLLKWCRQIGILPYWNLLWGFPGEPPEEYAQVARLLPALMHLEPPAGADRIRLDRFSPHFEQADDFGFTDIEPARAYALVYPLSAPTLNDIAYYFDYEYADRRDVDGYTASLRAGVKTWKEAHGASELVTMRLADRLVVVDSRPLSGGGSVEVLSGLAAELVLACDALSTASALAEAVSRGAYPKASVEEVTAALEPLIAKGYILRDGNTYLSLTLSVDAGYRPNLAIVQELLRRHRRRCAA